MARTKINKGSGYNRLGYITIWILNGECAKNIRMEKKKKAIQRKKGIKSRTNIVIWLWQFGLNDKVNPFIQNKQLSLNMPHCYTKRSISHFAFMHLFNNFKQY